MLTDVRQGPAIERNRIRDRLPEKATKAELLKKRLHCLSEDVFPFRRWRTISYSTTAAATETFSDGTLPSIGIETRKSHFLFTRSCRPLPSAPSTSAQSML